MKKLLILLAMVMVVVCLAHPADAAGARNASIQTQRLILLMAADEANNDADNPYGYRIAPTFYSGGLFGNRQYVGYSLVPVLKSPVKATVVESPEQMIQRLRLEHHLRDVVVPPQQPEAQPTAQVQPIVIMPQLPAQPAQPAASQRPARGYWQWVPQPAE